MFWYSLRVAPGYAWDAMAGWHRTSRWRPVKCTGFKRQCLGSGPHLCLYTDSSMHERGAEANRKVSSGCGVWPRPHPRHSRERTHNIKRVLHGMLCRLLGGQPASHVVSSTPWVLAAVNHGAALDRRPVTSGASGRFWANPDPKPVARTIGASGSWAPRKRQSRLAIDGRSQKITDKRIRHTQILSYAHTDQPRKAPKEQ